jgi:hypothetical protein
MKINRSLFSLLILCCAVSAFGQSTCDKKNLIGKWMQVESIAGDQSTKVDSLKLVIANSYGDFATLTIFSDDKYTYRWGDEPEDKKKKTYKFDQKSCQIILREKGRTDNQTNIEIIYIDRKYLIYMEDNYPRGYWTHLLKRM